jgi:DNA-binding PadR family transcriptional regulator
LNGVLTKPGSELYNRNGYMTNTGITVRPLTAAEFQILLALGEGEQHGYGISKEVERSTAGSIRLGFTTLYRHLKQMRTEGWIQEIDSGDPRRRSYRLTRRGRSVVQAEAARLTEALRLAKERKLIAADMTL